MTKEEATALALERLGAGEVAKRSEAAGLCLDYMQASAAVLKRRREKINAYVETLEADPEIAALKAAADNAEAAWHGFTGIDSDLLGYNYEGEPEVCALTGVPLFQNDEVLHDYDIGGNILRAALPLPPVVMVDEPEESEAEEVEVAAE